MGIVAYCPSGHRMKVKDYLAGRKGICPTCGARFRIPVASMASPPATVPATPAVARAQAVVEPAAELTARSIPHDLRITALSGSSAVATVVSLDPVVAAGLPEVLMLAATVEAGGPADPSPAIAPQIDPDPTADLEIEAEDEGDDDVLFWYHATPGGQPSAALRELEMVSWLDSGQATGREVVWRSDWPGWKPIGEAFPERFPPSFPGPGRS